MDRPDLVSIVVPVCNEAALLPVTAPRLLASAAEVGASVVWVCNGCTDDSARILRSLTGQARNVRVIEIVAQSKTMALQTGDDALGGVFPRFYIDADIHLQPGDLSRLCAKLQSGAADLVGPALDLDFSQSSWLAAAMARCWLALPQAKEMAISGVIGLSQAGRARWGRWPDLLGDDIFVRAIVPVALSCRVPATLASSPAPKSFGTWMRTRKRWLVGEAQLRRMGLSCPHHPDQRAALRARLLNGPERLGAVAFLAARLLAGLTPPAFATRGWSPERK